MDPTALDPTKLTPLLIGPGGAIAALLIFIGYLMNEVRVARGDRDKYQGRYEQMREQRDDFRFLAGDAVRASKRSSVTQIALMRHGLHKVEQDLEDEKQAS